jgi:hypothetical protein
MDSIPPHVEPLLQTMRDLLVAYGRCVECAQDLVAGLVSGNPSVVQTATAAQTAAFGEMEAAERRRRQVELALTRSLTGWDQTGSPQGRLTTTALMARLPAEQASELSLLRHDLLQVLVRLQALQSHSGVLARSALAVLRRTCAPTGGLPIYGSHGEQDATSHKAQSHVWRSA